MCIRDRVSDVGSASMKGSVGRIEPGEEPSLTFEQAGGSLPVDIEASGPFSVGAVPEGFSVEVINGRVTDVYKRQLFERITVLHPHEGYAIDCPALRGFDEKIP